jgi:hypothetical protein
MESLLMRPPLDNLYVALVEEMLATRLKELQSKKKQR